MIVTELTKADIPRLEELFTRIQQLNGKDIFENMAWDELNRLIEKYLLEIYTSKFSTKEHRNFLTAVLYFVDRQTSKRGGVDCILPRRVPKETLEYRLIFGNNDEGMDESLYYGLTDTADLVSRGELTPEQFIEKYAPIFAEIVESKIVK